MANQSEPPLVSVILPTYNRAYCISPAIESVLRQTHTNLELIIVDDCSTDNTADLLATITDPRLRVVRHERNRGAAAARNSGIAAAQGDLIVLPETAFPVFLSDMPPGYLAELDASLRLKKAALISRFLNIT